MLQRLLVAALVSQQLFFAMPINAAIQLQEGKPLGGSATGAVSSAVVESRADTNKFTGEANVTVPITVPPGTGGHTPRVALVYGSHGSNQNSPVGAGWKLDIGPASIERSTRDGAPNYDPSDEFQLAGADLIETATPGRFVTENYDHSRIEHITVGGDYWVVLRPDGMRLYYGFENGVNGNESRLDSEQVVARFHTSTSCPDPFAATCAFPLEEIVPAGIPFAWYLDRIEDRNGNVISYSWSTEGDQGARYLKQIVYSGHVSGAATQSPSFGANDDGTLSRDRTISFYYDLIQNDTLPTYRAGFAREITRRLTDIEVAVGPQRVRHIELDHVTSPVSGRALLEAVRERGADDSATNEFEHSFTYKPGGGAGWSMLDNAWELPRPSPMDPPLPLVDANGMDTGVRILDVNGDGWADVMSAASGQTNATYLGGPGGFSDTPSGLWASPVPFRDSRGFVGVGIGDFDGDGRPDMIRRDVEISGYNNTAMSCGGEGNSRHHEVAVSTNFEAWRNTGSGWVADPSQVFSGEDLQTTAVLGGIGGSCPTEHFALAIEVDRVGVRFDQATRILDINGDGLDDLAYSRVLNGSHPESGLLVVTDEIRAGARLNGPGGLAAADINHVHDARIFSIFNQVRNLEEIYGRLYDSPRWQVPPGTNIASLPYLPWSNLNSCWSTQNALGEVYTGPERFVDFNGDGLPDFIASGRFREIDEQNFAGFAELHLNNGYSWKVAGEGTPGSYESLLFGPPTSFWFYHYEIDQGSFDTFDLGFGFSECQEGIAGLGTGTGAQAVDLNGDGQTDLLVDGVLANSRRFNPFFLLQNGGWVIDTSWNAPVSLAAGNDGEDPGVRIVDVNADGMVDIVVSEGAYLNQAEPPDKIETVTSPWGAMTTFSYVPHTTFDTVLPETNPSVDGQHRQGQPVWVVESVEVDPGAAYGQPTSLREFEYFDGVYDEDDRSFRGFEEVVELGPIVGSERSLQRTYFWADDGLRGQPAEIQFAEVPATDPGSESLLRILRYSYAEASAADTAAVVRHPDGSTESLTSIDSLTQSEAFDQFAAIVGPNPEARLALAIITENEAVEGVAPTKISRTERSYDRHGNVRVNRALGDSSSANDDVTTTTTYALLEVDGGGSTPSVLLADRVLTETVVGVQGDLPVGTNLEREIRVYYDESTILGTVVRGNPTAVDRLWKRGAPEQAWVRIDREFDAYGNVLKKSSPYELGGTDLVSHSQFVYDTAAQAFVTSMSVLDENDPDLTLTVTFEYEDFGGGTGCGGAPGMGLICRATDANGAVGLATYDPFGRLTFASGPNGAERVVLYHDSDRGTIDQRTEERMRWDPSGASGAGALAADADAIRYITSYDGLLRTTKVRSEQGTATQNATISYDAAGRVSGATRWNDGAALGPSTGYLYDVLNRVVRIDRSDAGFSVASYEPWKVTMTHHTTQGVDPGLKKKRVHELDGFGRLAAVEEYEDPTGAAFKTTYSYDPFGANVRVEDAVANNPSLCDPVCQGQRHETLVFFDELGSRVRLDDPDTGTWLDEPNARGLTEMQTDPRGVVHEFEYDALGRLVRREALTQVEGRDDLKVLHRYFYGGLTTPVPNGIGRLVRIEDGEGSADFEYDESGNTTKHTRVLEGKEFVFDHAYDPLGRRSSTLYPDGEAVTWHYDGRFLDRISTAGGDYADDYVASIIYDALDRPTQIELGGSAGVPVVTQTWTYDPTSGRLDLIGAMAGGQSVATIDLAVNQLGQVEAYDTDLAFPGASTTISRDADFTYDGLDRLKSATGNFDSDHTVSKTLSYTYDALGNLTAKDFVAGSEGWAFVNNDPDRPHAMTIALHPTLFPQRGYEYDDAGNVTRKTFQESSGSVLQEELYTYDSLGQLVEQRPKSGALTEMGYDALGRRVTTSRGTATLVYPEPGYEYHLEKTRVNKHFFVDGRRVASSEMNWVAPAPAVAPGGWRLPSLPSPPQWTPMVLYLGTLLLLLGLSLQRRPGTRSRGMRALSVLVIASVAPPLLAGRPRPGISDLGTHTETALFYVTDHLGSTLVTVRADGTVRNHNTFRPFGDTILTGGTAIHHRYTGAEELPGTTVHSLGPRGYDLELGRFLSPDPLVPDTADPQSYNRYSYVLNNPMDLLDPSGLNPESSGASEGGCGACIDIVIYVPGPTGPSGPPPAPPPAVSEATNVPTPNQPVGSPTSSSPTPTSTGPSAANTDEGPSIFGRIGDLAGYGQLIPIPQVILVAKGVEITARVLDRDVEGVLTAVAPGGSLLKKFKRLGAISKGGAGPVNKGKAGVARTRKNRTARGEKLSGGEVTVENPDGTRSRVDSVFRRDDELVFVESKNGPSARLSRNQKTTRQTLEGGGTVVPRGANAEAAGLDPGKPIGGTFEVDQFDPPVP